MLLGLVVAALPGAGALTIPWVIGWYSIAAGIPRIAAAYRIRKLASNVEGAIGAVRSAVGAMRT